MSLKLKRAWLPWRPLVVLALVIGLAAPVISASEAVAQTALPEIAAAAPESTVLFQSFNLDLDSEQWQQAETLLSRVGMPNALDLWRDEILSEGAKSDDFTESDLDALLGGEMAIVVTQPAIERLLEMHLRDLESHGDHGAMADSATAIAESADTPHGLAVVLEPGDPVGAWDYVVRQMTSFAQERGLELQVASGPGADLIWTERDGAPSGATSDDPLADYFGHRGHGAFAVGHTGNYIIAGKSPADVTAIMEVIDGTAPSLAESEAAQRVMAQLPAASLSTTFIDGQAILGTLDPEIMASLEGYMPEGVRGDAWGGYAGMTISAEEAGFRLDAISRVGEGVDPSALIVPDDPSIAAMAEQAPAGTFIYQAGVLPPNAFAGAPFTLAQAVNSAVSGQQWGDEAMDMFPSPEEMEEQIAMATGILGFNPASDLFELLGNEFIAFSGFPSIGMDGFSLDAVAAVATSDAAALAETMQKIAAWIDRAEPTADVSVRRVGNDTVYVVSDPESAEAPSIEFGVVGDQAVVAIGDGIAELQGEPAASLAEDEQFQNVMELLPSEYSQVAYLDIGQAIGLAMMFTGEFGAAQITDADLACAAYGSQAEAQAALDADAMANADLDLDFDGVACEDAFSTAGGTPTALVGGPENLRALAMVSYEEDESAGTSVILYIPEPGA